MTDLYSQYPVLDAVAYAYDGSIAVDIGDLMYHDTNDAKPASSQADGGTEVLNQRTFAARFAGVAHERKVTTDAAGTVDVIPIWIGEMTCISNTFEVGDLVTVDEAASGTALEDQVLAKTTDLDLALGFVTKRAAAATTTVSVCLLSRVTAPGQNPSQRIGRLESQSLAVAAFTDGAGTSGYIDFSNTLPAGAIVLGWKAVVSGAFAGDTSAVISVGISGDTDKYSANTAQSCFTTGTVGSAALAADTWTAAAAAPRVTVTGAADFTSIVTNAGGVMVVTIYYIPTV